MPRRLGQYLGTPIRMSGRCSSQLGGPRLDTATRRDHSAIASPFEADVLEGRFPCGSPFCAAIERRSRPCSSPRKILAGEVENPFTVRQVNRHHGSGLKATEVVEWAVGELEEAGWLASRSAGSGGQKKVCSTSTRRCSRCRRSQWHRWHLALPGGMDRGEVR